LSAAAFPLDEVLLTAVATRLRSHPSLRFVMGGAGTGKSSVCRQLHASVDVPVIDMDARMYGIWGDRWDRVRHPANSAWMGAADPLDWQLALAPEAFLQFHAAATAEALDLLADEFGQIGQVGETDDDAPVLVDGGFGSIAVVARAVPPASIVCLDLPPGGSEAVWTSDPGRLGFLEAVAAATAVQDPVARFLACDAALSERMVADAAAAGVVVIARSPETPLETTAGLVATALGLR
jgi:hypothetical protein